MVTVALFHSVYGRRTVELRAAQRLRVLGHEVHVPDLYAGRTASSLDAGFELKDEIGWDTIVGRAHASLDELPDDTALIGFSMGAGVIHDLLPDRSATAGVLLLHGLADFPTWARPGLPIQLHIAAPDIFAPPERIATWQATAIRREASAQVFTYPGVGHFYTDESLPDYNREAATLTWQRAIDFLGTLESGHVNGEGKNLP
ncbi:dienelactone hydrolase family protein [Nocardia iowensis]|uniref:Dienelactone hydrolase family protein n=1 Tax=Nocardia iowensis TaxID=204891 RepID=A0ABX8RQI8_NOCIO|nr:dienelactone hydrolase family protein [Nocardia iowensis]QXN90575.1 dienelactone hydrolase family protein [Nocardia iowensis]